MNSWPAMSALTPTQAILVPVRRSAPLVDEVVFPALGAPLPALPLRTPRSGVNALRTSRLRSRSPDLCAPSPSLASPRLRALS